MRLNLRIMFSLVHDLGCMHHHQRPKTFIYEAKVAVVNALKIPKAHHWGGSALTKQPLNTGTLRAMNLADVPADACVINLL